MKVDIGLLILRLFAGTRIIYGVADNIFSSEKMHEFKDFLAAHHFPVPLFSAYLSVYVQFIGGLLLLVGWQTKWAALVLAINFLVALFMVHVPNGDSFEAMTPALALLFIALCLLFSGPGKFSLDGSSITHVV